MVRALAFHRQCVSGQEPITRSLQLPHIPVTAFSQTGLFFSLNLSRIQSTHRNLSGQLQSQARTNVGISTCLRGATLFYPFRSVAHVDCNWPISREKISKNRLVCKNAVVLAYYGSCRLLVMGSYREPATGQNYKI